MFDKHMFDKHISRISYFYFAKWSNLTSIFFRWVGSTNHHLGIPRSREVGFDHIFESPTKKQAALDFIDELHCLFNGPQLWWSTNWGCTLPRKLLVTCHLKMDATRRWSFLFGAWLGLFSVAFLLLKLREFRSISKAQLLDVAGHQPRHGAMICRLPQLKNPIPLKAKCNCYVTWVLMMWPAEVCLCFCEKSWKLVFCFSECFIANCRL